MRRPLSLVCLLLAWLCAQGAVWNVVQVVAWARMLHEYSQVMPVAQAIQVTFDGSAPCDLCVMTRTAQDTDRDQSPGETLPAAENKLLLSCMTADPFVLTAPDFSWPGLVPEVGLVRTEAVPVRPPRV